MTKKLNPLDVLRTVKMFVEQYNDALVMLDDLEEERDELQARVEELKEDLNARVDELEEDIEGLEHERDTLRDIARDLDKRLSAAMRDNADGMRVATYNALHSLKTTLDDLIGIDDNGFQTVLDAAAYVVETLQQPLDNVYEKLESGIQFQFRNFGRVNIVLMGGKTLRIEPATLTNAATVWIE